MGYHSHYTDWAVGWAVWDLNPSRGRDFSRPILGPTQLAVRWLLDSSFPRSKAAGTRG